MATSTDYVSRESIQSNLFDGKLNGFDRSLPVLQWLDDRLEQAITVHQAAGGAENIADPYLGLHIDEATIEQLLTREPGVPAFPLPHLALEAAFGQALQISSRFAWLQQAFDLSLFEMGIVVIAIAPDFDLRYERLYAYLQDDVTRKLPSIDLALNLLCPDAEIKRIQQAIFAPQSPLIRWGLLHLLPHPHQPQSSFLSLTLKLDEQVSRFLRGQTGLDLQLASCCEFIKPDINLDTSILDHSIQQGLQSLARSIKTTTLLPPLLYFQGTSGLGQQTAATALAMELRYPLLVANLVQALSSKLDFSQWLQRLWREAKLQSAVLYLEGLDSLRSSDQTIAYAQLLKALASSPQITILTGAQAWIPTDCPN